MRNISHEHCQIIFLWRRVWQEPAVDRSLVLRHSSLIRLLIWWMQQYIKSCCNFGSVLTQFRLVLEWQKFSHLCCLLTRESTQNCIQAGVCWAVFCRITTFIGVCGSNKAKLTCGSWNSSVGQYYCRWQIHWLLKRKRIAASLTFTCLILSYALGLSCIQAGLLWYSCKFQWVKT